MEILLQSIVGVEMEYSSSVIWIEAITIAHILFDFLLLPKMAIIRKKLFKYEGYMNQQRMY